MHAAHELLAIVLVGVGRALALPEAAERAADDADVRDVDVAVDDEGHGLAGQLGAQLVGGLAQVLDRLRPRLGEERGELVLGQRARRRAPRAIAPATRSARIARRLGAPRAAARDEAPVARLDDVEHALRDPLGVDVAAGRRTGARSAPRRRAPGACAPGGATGTGARARCGRRWRSGRRGRSRRRRRARATSRRGWAGPGRRRRASAGAPRPPGASCPRSPIGVAHAGRSRCGASDRPVRQKRSAASVAISAGSSP